MRSYSVDEFREAWNTPNGVIFRKGNKMKRNILPSQIKAEDGKKFIGSYLALLTLAFDIIRACYAPQVMHWSFGAASCARRAFINEYGKLINWRSRFFIDQILFRRLYFTNVFFVIFEPIRKIS